MHRSRNDPHNKLALVTVVMPHKLTYKMATDTVSAIESLASIDEDISFKYLPNHDILSERVIGRGLNYFTQGYVHDIKLYVNKQ